MTTRWGRLWAQPALEAWGAPERRQRDAQTCAQRARDAALDAAAALEAGDWDRARDLLKRAQRQSGEAVDLRRPAVRAGRW